MPPHPSSGTLIRIGNNSDDLSVLLALFLKCFTSRAASRGDIVRRLLLESADTSTIGNNHDRRVRGLFSSLPHVIITRTSTILVRVLLEC